MKRRAGFLAIVLAAAATEAGAGYEDGLAYFKGGKPAEAAVEFQEAVDADASEDRAWFLLAQCLRQMGRPNEAERALERALGVRPERPEYRHALALVLRDLGRPAEAVGEAAEGLRRQPGAGLPERLPLTKLCALTPARQDTMPELQLLPPNLAIQAL